MRHIRNGRLGWISRAGLAILLAVLCCGTPALAQVTGRDPVEALRKALLTKTETKEDAKRRAALMARYADQLQRIGDLRLALSFPGWKVDDDADVALKEKLAKRFTTKMHAALDPKEDRDPLARRAAADLLADIGSSRSSTGTDEPDYLVRPFAPDLVNLVNNDPNLQVRAAAARALGKIHAGATVKWQVKGDKAELVDVASEAVKALKELLQPGKASLLRRAAAEGLYQMVHSIARAPKISGPYRGIEAMAVCLEVVPIAGDFLLDPDLVVRRQCVQAIRSAALVLGDLPIPAVEPIYRTYEKANEQVQSQSRDVSRKEEDQKTLDLARALSRQGPRLAKLLNDPDGRTRLQVRRTLVEMADTRKKLIEGPAKPPYLLEKDKKKVVRDGNLPDQETAKGDIKLAANEQVVLADDKPAAKAEDELLEGMKPSVRVLARGLTDPRPRARLDSLLFLQLLGPAASDAKYALVRAMADPNPFVRWAAARTLGTSRPRTREETPPPLAKLAVPALSKLLKDPDIDLRLAAAATLELYGPAAVPAVDALIGTLQAGDPEIRIAAMHTLLSIGPPAKKAIPALITLLGNEDAQLREEAAKTVSRFGPAARAAVPALRKLLNDSNLDVRRAASEALLNIRLAEK